MRRDLMIVGALISLVALAFYGALGGHAAPPPGSDGARDLTGMVDPRVTHIQTTICRRGWTRTLRLSRNVTDAIKRNLVADMRVRPRDYELDYIVTLDLGGAPLDLRNLMLLQRIPSGRFWMHEGVDQLATLYPLCFFREHELRRPLKIGIREDIIAQHPELRPSVIVSALQNYTRCVPYWTTLKAGAARIDLDGNVAGQVTLEDEQAAKVKIAKAERRAKTREIEDRQKMPAQSLPRQPPSRRR